jgi:1-deoxy-D-xylulose-5-phosphate synthase
MALLETVRDPARLCELTAGEIRDLAGEIRAFLIERISATGGHLGPTSGPTWVWSS